MAMKLHKDYKFMGVPAITPDETMVRKLRRSTPVSKLVAEYNAKREAAMKQEAVAVKA